MPDLGPEQITPCPPGCEIPADIHRHYQREPGDYFELAAPLACCGRGFMRLDEVTVFEQCAWCREDGKPLPGMIPLAPARAGCRQIDGTWIHNGGGPHSCPAYLRGAKPNRRRMQP